MGLSSDPPQSTSRRTDTSLVYFSPLRYPGGKRRLAQFLALLFRANHLLDGEYVEAYAGGAAVALTLLYGEYARRIHLNDLDPGVHAFWLACRDHTEDMCRLVRDCPLDVSEWDRQRAVQKGTNPDPLELGFSTLYLNRTNRSGVITGGLIGGRQQAGRWKIDARFNRRDLVRRIERIGRWASRIALYNLDGAVFLTEVASRLGPKTLVYLDPPYYVKGQELYTNYYTAADHAQVARIVGQLPMPWVVSYDDHPQVRELYGHSQMLTYDIAYGASVRYRGREVAFFANALTIPDVADPARLSAAQVARFFN